MRVRVVAAWAASYDPALKVSPGEALTAGRRDDEWPGWVWCENRHGLGGWLPDEMVRDGRAVAGFDTRELSVAIGDRVKVLQRRAGWTRCATRDGAEGWVPDRCLATE